MTACLKFPCPYIHTHGSKLIHSAPVHAGGYCAILRQQFIVRARVRQGERKASLPIGLVELRPQAQTRQKGMQAEAASRTFFLVLKARRISLLDVCREDLALPPPRPPHLQLNLQISPVETRRGRRPFSAHHHFPCTPVKPACRPKSLPPGDT